jgi:anti-sigma B factor antagonist
MSVRPSPAVTPTHMHLVTGFAAPGTVIVAVIGEVDMATAPALQAGLLAALNDHAPAVVDIDLSACTFLDCSGISVLVSAHATAQASGCQMWARYPQRTVRLVLEVTGLLGMFTAPDDTAAKTANTASPTPLPVPAETTALSVLATAT